MRSLTSHILINAMKPFVLPSYLCLLSTAYGGDGVLDLTRLANYANQSRPAYITKNNTTNGNAITDRGATLGRVLFHDRRLSRNNSVSCSSCHAQSHAFSDPASASTGVSGTTGRHSMRLINSRFGNEVRFFWDERASTLENQTSQPIKDHVEMGFSGTDGDPAFADLVARLSALDEYRVLFSMTYGDAAINETRVQQSLAQFIRSIQSFDSKFDIGRAQVANNNANFPNFTAQENSGKTLFLNPPGGPQGGAGCAACHVPPEFDIDPNSRNNGVIGAIGGGTDTTNTRSPSLRDLIGPGGQSNGPFMHDGSFATLAQVINHYNLIPGDNANLDPRLRRPGGVQNLGLNQNQRNDLAAFLATLTGTSVYTDEKWSDPFDEENRLSLIVLPADSVRITDHGNQTATVSCFGVPGMNYRLESSTDLKKWSFVTTITADTVGTCQQLVPVSETVFYRYAYEPPAR
jgi:cytochrome c peroxidase